MVVFRYIYSCKKTDIPEALICQIKYKSNVTFNLICSRKIFKLTKFILEKHSLT